MFTDQYVSASFVVDDIDEYFRFRYDTERANGKLQHTTTNGEKVTPKVRVTTSRNGSYIFYASCVTSNDPPQPHATHLVGGRSNGCENGVFRKRLEVSGGYAELELDCGVQCSKKEKAVERYRTKLEAGFGNEGQPLVPSKTEHRLEILGNHHFEDLDINEMRLYFSLFYVEGSKRRLVASCLSNVLKNSVNINLELKIVAMQPAQIPVNGGEVILLTTKFKQKAKVFLTSGSESTSDRLLAECTAKQHYKCALHVQVPDLSDKSLQFSSESCVEAYLWVMDGASSSHAYPINVTKPHSTTSLTSKRMRTDFSPFLQDSATGHSTRPANSSSSIVAASTSAANQPRIIQFQPRAATNYAASASTTLSFPPQAQQHLPASQPSLPAMPIDVSSDSYTYPKSATADVEADDNEEHRREAVAKIAQDLKTSANELLNTRNTLSNPAPQASSSAAVASADSSLGLLADFGTLSTDADFSEILKLDFGDSQQFDLQPDQEDVDLVDHMLNLD